MDNQSFDKAIQLILLKLKPMNWYPSLCLFNSRSFRASLKKYTSESNQEYLFEYLKSN